MDVNPYIGAALIGVIVTVLNIGYNLIRDRAARPGTLVAIIAQLQSTVGNSLNTQSAMGIEISTLRLKLDAANEQIDAQAAELVAAKTESEQSKVRAETAKKAAEDCQSLYDGMAIRMKAQDEEIKRLHEHADINRETRKAQTEMALTLSKTVAILTTPPETPAPAADEPPVENSHLPGETAG